MIKYRVCDELVADFLFMYCEGKSSLWRMFFGWRRTSENAWDFIVSPKAYTAANEWASSVRGRIARGENL
jgi:hypothetical protein